MTLKSLLRQKKLEGALLLGYYGGGNFGDELLLAALLTLFRKNNIQRVTYYYSNPAFHRMFHHRSQYPAIYGKTRLFSRLLSSRSIIVGGGGHWGLDMNLRVLIMSILLYVLHFILRKEIYLVGVGFYDSTSKMGRLSAYLAAKSSSMILARDEETHRNFKKYNKSTWLDKDIGFYLDGVNLEEYENEACMIADEMGVSSNKKYLIITLRRFQAKYTNRYQELVKRLVKAEDSYRVILMTLEPREVDPMGYAFMMHMETLRPDIVVSDFRYSPLAFVRFCENFSSSINLISPQYHAQLVASLVGVRHMPLVYDNKVKELLSMLGVEKTVDINLLRYFDIEMFLHEV